MASCSEYTAFICTWLTKSLLILEINYVFGGKKKTGLQRIDQESQGGNKGIWGFEAFKRVDRLLYLRNMVAYWLQASSTAACATACAIFCTSGMSALGVIDSKVEGSSAPRALLEWREKETFSQRKSLHFMTENFDYKICWEFTLIFLCQILKSSWSLYKSFWILVLGRVVQIAIRETRITS